MVSVAIWFVSARNVTHSLLVFADLGAKNGLTPDECAAIQCVLGFAYSTAEKVTEAFRGPLEAARLNRAGGGITCDVRYDLSETHMVLVVSYL